MRRNRGSRFRKFRIAQFHRLNNRWASLDIERMISIQRTINGRIDGNRRREDGAYVAGNDETAQVGQVASVLFLPLLRPMTRHLLLLLLLLLLQTLSCFSQILTANHRTRNLPTERRSLRLLRSVTPRELSEETSGFSLSR